MAEFAKNLLQIGLSENEARIYETLLSMGKAGAGILLRKIPEIKRGNLYNVLYGLVEKNLITETSEAGKKIFIVEPPNRLQQFIERKERESREALRNFEASLPEMKSLYNLAMHRPNVRLFEGVEGIKRVYEDTLRHPGGVISAILSTETPDPEIYEWLTKNYVHRRVQAKITARVIVAESATATGYIEKNTDELRETIIVPKERFPIATEIDIYGGDKIAHISFGTKELIGFIIESKEVYRSMLSFFELAWFGAESKKLMMTSETRSVV